MGEPPLLTYPDFATLNEVFRYSDRLAFHLLICFLSMVILKILQKQIDMPDSTLTDRLQEINDICIDTRIVKQKTINAIYRNMLK